MLGVKPDNFSASACKYINKYIKFFALSFTGDKSSDKSLGF